MRSFWSCRDPCASLFFSFFLLVHAQVFCIRISCLRPSPRRAFFHGCLARTCGNGAYERRGKTLVSYGSMLASHSLFFSLMNRSRWFWYLPSPPLLFFSSRISSKEPNIRKQRKSTCLSFLKNASDTTYTVCSFYYIWKRISVSFFLPFIPFYVVCWVTLDRRLLFFFPLFPVSVSTESCWLSDNNDCRFSCLSSGSCPFFPWQRFKEKKVDWPSSLPSMLRVIGTDQRSLSAQLTTQSALKWIPGNHLKTVWAVGSRCPRHTRAELKKERREEKKTPYLTAL